MFLWTAEAVADGRGIRVLGTGSLRERLWFRHRSPKIFPAVLSVHLTALNANGKAYATDHVYQLNK